MSKMLLAYLRLPETLRQMRINKGFKTKKEFAKAVGLPYTTYSNYENGSRVPSMDNLERIAKTLGVTVDDLCLSLDLDRLADQLGKTIEEPEFSDEMHYALTPDEVALLTLYNQLNDAGKQAAMQRLQELRYVPGYQNESPSGQEEPKTTWEP